MLVRSHSDLHLEGFVGTDVVELANHFIPKQETDWDTVLILAGDVSSKLPQLRLFLTELSGRFKHIFFVPGNHEYYRHDYDFWNEQATKFFNEIPNLSFAVGDVGAKIIDGVRFVFGTMWADGGPQQHQEEVSFYMNDFRLIEFKGDAFTINDMIAINQQHKFEIDRITKNQFDGKTVVITHHMPSYRLCHPRFGGNCNGGFATDCDYMFFDNSIDYWFFGHTHDKIVKQIGETKLICNPTGYRGEWVENRRSYVELAGGEINTFEIEGKNANQ